MARLAEMIVTCEQVKTKVEELIGIVDRTKPVKTTSSLEDLFAYLRTKIVYTLFDLEATRRESNGK